MKVLVTGGCGFLGSHVCAFYRKLGWDAVSYDSMTKYELARTGYNADLARRHNWDLLSKLGVRLVEGDVRDAEALLAAAAGSDYIIHTAAQPAMTISVTDPRLDFTTNVLGTFNVLETARALGVPVVSCASIHVYGTGINDSLTEAATRYVRQPAGIDESHPVMTGALTPLHASKRAAEEYLLTYADCYGLKAASYRLTGLYGENQFGGEDHGWVAHFIISALRRQPITLFGTGKQLRDIIYASDVCAAFHAFFQHPVPGIYNIGGGEANAISLLECLAYLEELLGRRVEYRFGGERLGDLYYFVCDIAKAERLLHWAPAVRPREGIQRLLRWVESNRDIFCLP